MSQSAVTASGQMNAIHDDFQQTYIDCRVSWTYGTVVQISQLMVVNIQRSQVPSPYTHQDLAEACAIELGFPVTVWEPPAPPEA